MNTVIKIFKPTLAFNLIFLAVYFVEDAVDAVKDVAEGAADAVGDAIDAVKDAFTSDDSKDDK